MIGIRTFRREICVMSMVFGAVDGEQTREVFPEDQIQLIGIEAREFDDLADLETERPFYRTQSPTRLAKWESQSPGVSHISPEVCPARKQRPGELLPLIRSRG